MPGTLVFDPADTLTRVSLLAYGPEAYIEEEIQDISRLGALREEWPVVWLNIDGVGDESVLRDLGEKLTIHRLVLEDIVNVGQRSKAEFYEGQVFVVLRMPEADWAANEQVSLILSPGLVVTVQERVGDCFDPVRDRIRHGKGKIRERGADYLAYAIMDAVVDRYFPALDQAGEALDVIEEQVFASSSSDTLLQLHILKRKLVAVRKAISPHREMLNLVMRDAGENFKPETMPYLRDCYDHVVRLIDLSGAQREVASDLLQTYLSLVSNRMNEVMKVLTIIATLFIPLSFIAGLYGMNFDPGVSPWNMPELGWQFGYPAALLLMGAVAVGLLMFVKRRGWM
jgi:magnesium transporter